jgi:uncharacterized protein (TIGR02757 family)
MNSKQLKEKLDYYYQTFDRSKISPDPLEFPHRFQDYYDIEISAFISSIFAYGNIKQIIAILEKIHSSINNQPFQFLKSYDRKKGRETFENIFFRFYTTNDIVVLFKVLKNIYDENGSIKNLFMNCYLNSGENITEAITCFSKKMIKMMHTYTEITHGIKFMFPYPKKRSTCKRINLFLRWMVRKDDLDFGLWNEIPKNKLIIPVDTHIANISRKLNLTRQRNINWKMAEEITESLRKLDPIDPVKYDFALCHIGMRKMRF